MADSDKDHLLDDFFIDAFQQALTPAEEALLDLSKPPPPLSEEDRLELDNRGRDFVHRSVSSLGAHRHLQELLAVHHASHRTFPTVLMEAISDSGERGFVVTSSGLPSGNFDLQAVFREGSVLRRETLATFRVPIEFTHIRMTTAALAGLSTEAGQPSPESTDYREFQKRLRNAHPGARFTDPDGYITPQVKGAAVQLFLPLRERDNKQ